ncbi:MAG TPA: hypothetical protein PKD80_02575 [Microthrixaceae bacterium]|nr:hypothetical protein [Microthrixaceae bacterium]
MPHRGGRAEGFDERERCVVSDGIEDQQGAQHLGLPAGVRDESIGSTAEVPVVGSITWCRSLPSTVQRRFNGVDVATAPCAMLSVASTDPPPGDSTSMRQGPPSGDSPATRRSPPKLARMPVAPAASASSTTMSAARPLPMAPGSKPAVGLGSTGAPGSMPAAIVSNEAP